MALWLVVIIIMHLYLPLKYSDGAVDGGHYYIMHLYLGIICSLFASHRTSLVRHRSHAGRQPEVCSRVDLQLQLYLQVEV